MDSNTIIYGLYAILEGAENVRYLWEDPEILKDRRVDIFELSIIEKPIHIYVKMSDKGKFCFGCSEIAEGGNNELTPEEAYQRLEMIRIKYGYSFSKDKNYEIKVGDLINNFATRLLEPIDRYIEKRAEKLKREIESESLEGKL